MGEGINAKDFRGLIALGENNRRFVLLFITTRLISRHRDDTFTLGESTQQLPSLGSKGSVNLGSVG